MDHSCEEKRQNEVKGRSRGHLWVLDYLGSDEELLPLDLLADHLVEDLADLGLVEVDVGAVDVPVAVADGEPEPKCEPVIVSRFRI